MKRSIKFLALVLAICMVVTATISAAAIESFRDYVSQHWANVALSHSVDNSLLFGYEDNTLRADRNMSRAEMGAVLNRAFGAKVLGDSSKFIDIKSTDWYYTDVAKALQMQTFAGTSNTTFEPNRSIFREEAMVTIARAMVLDAGNLDALNKFTDASSVSSWAKNDIAALTEKKYVNGMSATTLEPHSKVTRAQVAQMLYNIFSDYISKPGTYSVNSERSLMINTPNVTLKDCTINGDLVLGDGVHDGYVIIQNVKVLGRVLVRGGDKVTFKSTTSNGGVVVKALNGTVNFQNYRDEKIFDNVKEYTKATYLQRSSGGSYTPPAPTTKYSVTFYDYDPLEGYKVKDTVSNLTSGSTVSSIPTMTNAMGGYVTGPGKTHEAANDLYDTNYIHPISYVWAYDNGTDIVEFTNTTKVYKNIDVYPYIKKLNTTLKLDKFEHVNSGEINLWVYYDNSRIADSIKDALWTNKNSILFAIDEAGIEDAILQKLDAKKLVDTNGWIYNQNQRLTLVDIIGDSKLDKFVTDAAKENINNDDAKDYLKTDIALLKELYKAYVLTLSNSQIIEILKKDPSYTDGDDFYTALDNAVSIMTSGTNRDTTIDTVVTYAMALLNGSPNKEKLLDAVVEEVYGSTIAQFLSELRNEETFSLYNDLTDALAMTMYNKFNGMSFDDFVNDISLPAGFDKLMSIDFVANLINKLFYDTLPPFLVQVQAQRDAYAADPSQTYYIDSYVTLRINPVIDLINPMYDKFRGLLENKLNDKETYKNNPYAKKLVDLLSPEYLLKALTVSYNADVYSGYAVLTAEELYTILYTAIVLADDAGKWCFDNVEESKLEATTDALEDKAIEYINFIISVIADYKENGTIPRIDDLPDGELKDIANEYGLQNIIDTMPQVQSLINKLISNTAFNNAIDKFYNSPLNDPITGVRYNDIKADLDVMFENYLNESFNVDKFFEAFLAEKLADSKVVESNKNILEKYKITNADSSITITKELIK